MSDLAKSKWSTTSTKSEKINGLGTSKWAVTTAINSETKTEEPSKKVHSPHSTKPAVSSDAQNLSKRLNPRSINTEEIFKNAERSNIKKNDQNKAQCRDIKAGEIDHIKQIETERAKYRSKKAASNLEWRDTAINGKTRQRNNGRSPLLERRRSIGDGQNGLTSSRIADSKNKTEIKHEPVDMISLQKELDNLGDDNDDDWDDI